uniref:Uncharacterized protein n=1 Tax=Timema bartmani TaxID=61472 RepID=A0A7R9HZF0_9NEOP|nr:unnamed protein product [Timema bartmani]
MVTRGPRGKGNFRGQSRGLARLESPRASANLGFPRSILVHTSHIDGKSSPVSVRWSAEKVVSGTWRERGFVCSLWPTLKTISGTLLNTRLVTVEPGSVYRHATIELRRKKVSDSSSGPQVLKRVGLESLADSLLLSHKLGTTNFETSRVVKTDTTLAAYERIQLHS